MKKKSLLNENGEPRFCLCQKRWYKILFFKNPLLINKYYWFGWIDPESWLEWWHLGVQPRWYYWKRDKWLNFPFTGWRDEQIWDYDNPVKVENSYLNRVTRDRELTSEDENTLRDMLKEPPKRTIDDNDARRSSSEGTDL